MRNSAGGTQTCPRRQFLAPMVKQAKIRRPTFLNAPPKAFRSGASSLLMSLENGASSSTASVFGKPLKEAERADLRQLLIRTDLLSDHAHGGYEPMQESLLRFLQDAVTHKEHDLGLVHGAMVLVEQLHKLNKGWHGRPSPSEVSPSDMRQRWQLVVGADVGAVQYIPVKEELQVAEDGATFSLDGDLTPVVGLFTSFSGDSRWLSHGHLSYQVRRVHIEIRRPTELARMIKAWKVRNSTGRELSPGNRPNISKSCSQDLDAPALSIPLPFFPSNELYIFASNGKVACSRSKLGGLILLAKTTV